MNSPSDLPGLDPAALSRYLDSAVPGLTTGELTAELIAGGRSNLTYLVHQQDSAPHSFILRRQPLGHVLPSAHDMKREYRVISALGDSPIPVPKALHHCPDPAAIGSPFYLMERVDGTIFRSSEELSAQGPGSVEEIAAQLINCLADLHAVDPEAVGLSDFGRAAGYNERQLARWSAQLDASRSRDLAGIDRLREALHAGVPDPSGTSIVHGDFRLDNVLFTGLPSRPEITAVLDWEMSTLGDPLSDLALMLLYASRPIPSGGVASQVPPLDVDGHPGVDDLIRAYADRSDRDVSNLRWYRAFAAFKLAVIIEGVHYRFQQGKTVGAGFDTIGDMVPGLIDEGLAVLAAPGRE